VAFVGVGTERLHREESRRTIARELAPRVRHWSVRSEYDRERLLASGVDGDRVTVAADLAWTLPRIDVDPGSPRPECLRARPGEELIGVNVTNERFVAERAPHLRGALGRLFDHLIEKRNARIVFFCNEIREDDSFDKAASQRIIREMAHRDRAAILPNEYRTPQQMMALIGACRLVIGMRYHFCLFAAIQGVPFVGVNRSDKVADLCRDLAWGHAVELDQADAARLEAMATGLLDEGPSAGKALLSRVAKMRDRVWLNCAALDALRGPTRT
jgi:polysaccharide pyruvyl transferase WcaK-like protein